MTKNTKTLLYVLGGATVLGIGGAVIYNAVKKPEAIQGNGSTPKMPPAGGASGSTEADIAAKAAADAAAVQAAIDAAIKKIAEATAAAARNAALTSVKSAFTSKHDAGGGSSIDVDAWSFIAGIQAAQAAGVAPNDVLGMVWDAAVAFFMSRGYGQGQAAGFATAAQLNAGFGQHQANYGMDQGKV